MKAKPGDDKEAPPSLGFQSEVSFNIELIHDYGEAIYE
jgi:hypothetical protein